MIRLNWDSLHRPSAVILCVLTHRADHSSIVSPFVGRQRTLSSGPFTRYFQALQFCIRPITIAHSILTFTFSLVA